MVLDRAKRSFSDQTPTRGRSSLQNPKALKLEQQLLDGWEGTQRRDRSKYPRAVHRHGEQAEPLYSRRPIGRVRVAITLTCP